MRKVEQMRKVPPMSSVKQFNRIPPHAQLTAIMKSMNDHQKPSKPPTNPHLLSAIFQTEETKPRRAPGQKKRKYPESGEFSKKRSRPNDLVTPTIITPQPGKKRRRKAATPRTPRERSRKRNPKSPGGRRNNNCQKRKPPASPRIFLRYKSFEWRKKSILIPDIKEIDMCNWPDSGSEDENKEEDLSNEAYLLRHYRAEMRERAFWHALQNWRREKEKGDDEEEEDGEELKVQKRPRGPWQFSLTRAERESKPTQIDEKTRFNYSHRLRPWKQPSKLIQRISLKRGGSIKEMVNGRKGKDLGMAYARLQEEKPKPVFDPDFHRVERIKRELERRANHFTFSEST